MSSMAIFCWPICTPRDKLTLSKSCIGFWALEPVKRRSRDRLSPGPPSCRAHGDDLVSSLQAIGAEFQRKFGLGKVGLDAGAPAGTRHRDIFLQVFQISPLFPAPSSAQNRYCLFDCEPPRRRCSPSFPETLSPGLFFKMGAGRSSVSWAASVLSLCTISSRMSKGGSGLVAKSTWARTGAPSAFCQMTSAISCEWESLDGNP